MGIYYDADLIYGIPVAAFEQASEANDYDPPATPFWSADNDDWIDIDDGHEDNLRFCQYGHYENPEGTYAILTSPRLESFNADCWTATKVDAADVPMLHDKALSKANDSLRSLGLPGDFYADAGWYLVCSVG